MSDARIAPDIAAAKRLVVKIGSALLAEENSGRVHAGWLNGLADDLAAARQRGQEVIVVSSGAIAVGRHRLGLGTRPLKLEESQAAAAAGQLLLAHAWQEALNRHGLTVGQVLLTLDDTERQRRRYLNARNTLDTLLKLGAVPVINENDTVATQEIRFGDNDRLAARVAAMSGADMLVLLSDIDGLYDRDPRHAAEARHIPMVTRIDDNIRAMAGAAGSSHGSGGMVTKLIAAEIAMAAGCAMAIAQGATDNPLSAIIGGGRCTWFLPAVEPRTARKNWIASGLEPHGTLVIDDGAKRALLNGRSLLPAGVTSVRGRFDRGDAVVIEDRNGQSIGRGLSAYNAEDARLIAGHKSDAIEARLGYRGRDEIVHRDDLVLALLTHATNDKAS